MNNFWLKKCEKNVTDVRKGKTRGRWEIFCIISFYFSPIKLGFYICFFNCRSCKCGQLSHNYIKRDLYDPNFSSKTIVNHFIVEQPQVFT